MNYKELAELVTERVGAGLNRIKEYSPDRFIEVVTLIDSARHAYEHQYCFDKSLIKKKLSGAGLFQELYGTVEYYFSDIAIYLLLWANRGG